MGDDDQERVTKSVLRAVRDFLGGPHPDGDEWRFDFGEHLESNWGAVYGGALAAGTLAVARAAAPDRSPRSLHIQIVRSVSRGVAYASARVRHAGRTVATVEVELYDERRKLACVALVTMITPGAVAVEHHDTTAPPLGLYWVLAPEEHLMPAPIVQSLEMLHGHDGVPMGPRFEHMRANVDGSLGAGAVATLPWEDLEHTGPEAACLVADAAIAAPVMVSTLPVEILGPNADLTLRFTTAPASRMVTAASSMLSVQHGTATVGIEVQSDGDQLAYGLATSLLLPPRE